VPERLTIGEFARRTGLAVSALRFYDKVGLLRPADVDPSSGYRRYDAGQLEEAELVRDLRRLEMSLSDIQAFLAAPLDVRHKRLLAHLEHRTAELRSAREVAARVRARLSQQEAPRPMSTMTVDREALVQAIEQIVPAASKDPELPLLQTVLVEASEGSLRLVATDRYRLAVRDLVARGEDGAAFRAVVASAALARIGRSLDAARDTVAVQHHDLALTIGADEQAGRLLIVPAEFPPYERLLVLDASAHSAVVGRDRLAAALEAVSDRDVCRLGLRPGSVDVDGVDVRAAYDGPELTVGLHPAFAQYAVASAVGPEVMIEVTEPVRPVVFRSATDSSYICMVMPIKLDA
jgi:DNA-binding transcriptional MerR regulator